MVRAVISSRPDYCSALYSGINQTPSLSMLQLVQNVAARLVTRTRKFEHITPVLAALHWLLVRFRLNFEIFRFIFMGVNGLAWAYISNLLTSCVPARALRSSDELLLVLPRSHFKSKGDKTFCFTSPKLWNSLPLNVRSAACLDTCIH